MAEPTGLELATSDVTGRIMFHAKSDNWCGGENYRTLGPTRSAMKPHIHASVTGTPTAQQVALKVPSSIAILTLSFLQFFFAWQAQIGVRLCNQASVTPLSLEQLLDA